MNRGVLPAVGAALLALSAIGASLMPVQLPAPSAAGADDRARVAVACPSLAGTANPTAVAAGSPQGGLALADLESPDRPTSVSGTFAVRTQVTGPVLVSAPRLDDFSGTTRTAATAGSDGGLSMMSCRRPTAAQWFTGVTSSATATAEVVLLNADTQDAAVDIAVYGAEGRVTAPGSRGIIVAGHSRRVVPLGPLFTAEQPVSLHVSTSSGRVAAAVRQRMLSDDRPAGSDWLPPTADPATVQVIPGVPAGKGLRDLVVVNPGERTASVALQVLGADGPTAVPGFETLDLPPGTTRTIPLSGALAAAPVGLRLSSEQRITASVVSGNGATAAAADISTQVATTALTGPGVLALSAGGAATQVLHLSSGVEDPVRVRVTAASADGTVRLDTTVTVAGLADATLNLPREGNLLVDVEPDVPGAVQASVAVRANLDALIGVSSLAVMSSAAAATLPPIRQDPRVGA